MSPSQAWTFPLPQVESSHPLLASFDMNQFHDFFLTYRPQCIVFCIFMTASIPILFYYRRRNPNPRFRPTSGEMAMVTLFAIVISAGMGVGLGGLFNERVDFSKLKGKPIQDTGSSGGGSIRRTHEDEDSDKKPSDRAFGERFNSERGK